MSQKSLLVFINQPLLAGDSPVSHSVVQETKKENKITDTSGPKCSASLESCNQNGLWGRMSQELLKSLSMTSSIVLKRKDTPRKHTVIQFRCSEPATRGNGSLLLPTITTQEVEHKKLNLTETGRRLTKDATDSHSVGLMDRIAMLPTVTTPRPHDSENTPGKYIPSQNQRDLTMVIGKNNPGLKLQPAFAEWMMGFPPEWTALNASEMPLYRSKSARSSKRL